MRDFLFFGLRLGSKMAKSTAQQLLVTQKVQVALGSPIPAHEDFELCWADQAATMKMRTSLCLDLRSLDKVASLLVVYSSQGPNPSESSPEPSPLRVLELQRLSLRGQGLGLSRTSRLELSHTSHQTRLLNLLVPRTMVGQPIQAWADQTAQVRTALEATHRCHQPQDHSLVSWTV